MYLDRILSSALIPSSVYARRHARAFLSRRVLNRSETRVVDDFQLFSGEEGGPRAKRLSPIAFVNPADIRQLDKLSQLPRRRYRRDKEALITFFRPADLAAFRACSAMRFHFSASMVFGSSMAMPALKVA